MASGEEAAICVRVCFDFGTWFSISFILFVHSICWLKTKRKAEGERKGEEIFKIYKNINTSIFLNKNKYRIFFTDISLVSLFYENIYFTF